MSPDQKRPEPALPEPEVQQGDGRSHTKDDQLKRIIKQHPQLKSTPVIMLSSKDGVFDRARGRLAGSDRYLTKPFTREGLIEAVSDYVKRASTSP